MCQKAEENLVKKNYHLAPKFFFHKTLPKDEKEKAKQVSKKMGAKIVDSEEDATHILYPSTGKNFKIVLQSFAIIMIINLPSTEVYAKGQKKSKLFFQADISSKN